MRECLMHWAGAHVRVTAEHHRLAGRQGTVHSPAACGARLRVWVGEELASIAPGDLERIEVALPRRLTAATVRETYTGADLRGSVRPGAEDFRQHPRRLGNRRYYADGRVEVVEP